MKKNTIKIGNHLAVISFDAEIDLFRGEFIGLNGGADFYADNIADLKKEAKASLDVFLQMCKEENITPERTYSGRFNVRVPPQIHAIAAKIAASEQVSLNQLVADALNQKINGQL